MKKSLFIALCALTAIVFAGCNRTEPETEPGTGVTIKIEPATLSMAVGQEQKLRTIIDPAGTTLSITWTSSNPEVVSVQSGMITAIAVGYATITASAEGATAGTCEISVTNDAVYDNFAVSDWGVFGGNVTVVPGTDTILELIDLGPTKCSLAKGFELRFWDTNLTYVRGQGYSGEGFMALCPDLSLYMITEKGDNEGAIILFADGFYVEDLTETGAKLNTAPAGKMKDLDLYGDYWKEVIAIMNGTSDYTQEDIGDLQEQLYLPSIEGAEMCIFYGNDNPQNLSLRMGEVLSANLYEDRNNANKKMYSVEVNWYDNVNPGWFYGLAVNEGVDDEGNPFVESIIEPYKTRFVNKSYTNIVPSEEEGTEPAEKVAKDKKQQYRILDPKRVHYGCDDLRNLRRVHK